MAPEAGAQCCRRRRQRRRRRHRRRRPGLPHRRRCQRTRTPTTRPTTTRPTPPAAARAPAIGLDRRQRRRRQRRAVCRRRRQRRRRRRRRGRSGLPHRRQPATTRRPRRRLRGQRRTAAAAAAATVRPRLRRLPFTGTDVIGIALAGLLALAGGLLLRRREDVHTLRCMPTHHRALTGAASAAPCCSWIGSRIWQRGAPRRGRSRRLVIVDDRAVAGRRARQAAAAQAKPLPVRIVSVPPLGLAFVHPRDWKRTVSGGSSA